jgi:hypothetical protein
MKDYLCCLYGFIIDDDERFQFDGPREAFRQHNIQTFPL